MNDDTIEDTIEEPAGKSREMCGLIMPISEIDGCSKKHWLDVKTILTEAIEDADLDSRLVSDSEYSGIIHKEIVQNIYTDKLVVCDVSASNPNVMFELGMRLAFDKPTIVIKDDVTKFNFDTSPIKHLQYRRDLRYMDMVQFKSDLSDLIKGTIEESSKSGYSTYLKTMGDFIEPVKIETKELSHDDYIIQELKILSDKVDRISKESNESIRGESNIGVPDGMLKRMIHKKLFAMDQINPEDYDSLKLYTFRNLRASDKTLSIGYDQHETCFNVVWNNVIRPKD
ncbi:MAG: RNA helicase [Blastopirellula sp.]|nr:MAG: RNA helicase [Blastopirellula sp.]